MQHLMRLIGRQRLCVLATSNNARIAGAISALSRELECADWSQPADALASFPKAELIGCRLRIALQDDYLVIIAVNCPAGILLVEFAGRTGNFK